MTGSYYPIAVTGFHFYRASVKLEYTKGGVSYILKVYHEVTDDWYLYAGGEEKTPYYIGRYATLVQALQACEEIELID